MCIMCYAQLLTSLVMLGVAQTTGKTKSHLYIGYR